MEDLKGKTSYGWIEFTNYDSGTEPDDTDSDRCGLCFIDGTLNYWNGTTWAEFTGGSGATTFVGLTDTPSNYTSAANKILKVNTGGTAVEFVTVSGDVSIGATGTTAIATGVIVNADINASAAIAWSKMAASTDIHTDGTVTGLSISADDGDILRYVGSAWMAVDPATLPGGVASGISQNFSIEANTYDIAVVTTTQTSSAPTVTIPDLAGVAQELVFTKKAQTFENKTLTSPVIGTSLVLNNTTRDMTVLWAEPTSTDNTVTFGDPGAADSVAYLDAEQTLANKTLTTPVIVTTGSIVDDGGDAYLTFVENADPTDSIQITQGGSGDGAKIESITSETNADLLLDAAGTGNVVIMDGTELTFARATKDALIVVADQTGEDHTFNIPDIATGASDTFAFLAEAQTLTNKTIAAGSNTITGLNGANMADIAGTNGTYGVEMTVIGVLAGAGSVEIFDANAPFKFRVLDAWAVETKGSNSGNWKLDNGTNDITAVVSFGGTDKAVTRVASIDDAYHEIAANGSLRVIASEGTDTAIVYVKILKITAA